MIDELVREGARRMLAEALRAEVDDYITRHLDERDANGRRLVVRNGTHQPREVLTSAGAVEVSAPRVNDRRANPDTGERRRFGSAILPPWCRKTPKISEVLPLLYLHGLSNGDFRPALGQFLGSSAGLSASVITKLTETWKAEQRTFSARDLRKVGYVYLWADGIHVNIRLEEHTLCLLVLVGGFWGALREVFPVTREQRCWFHKIANVLGATVRHRTKITRGPGSRAAGLAMAFKLIQAAQDRWRAVNAPHLVALVRAGATFTNGKLVERPEDHHQQAA